MKVMDSWWADHQDEVRKANRAAFRQMEKENGWVGEPREEIPGFVESVQSLYDYGYSLTDIGVFFGVTRERVRQWFERVPGLDRQGDNGGALYREWSWEHECFLPVTRDEVRERERSLKKERIRERRKAVRRGHVAALRELATQRGEPPITADLTEYLGYGRQGVAYVANYWRRSQDSDISYADAMDRLYRAADVERPEGRGRLAGEDSGTAKLTWKQVRALRDAAPGTWKEYEEWARRLECHPNNVYRILQGQTWRDDPMTTTPCQRIDQPTEPEAR